VLYTNGGRRAALTGGGAQPLERAETEDRKEAEAEAGTGAWTGVEVVVGIRVFVAVVVEGWVCAGKVVKAHCGRACCMAREISPTA
jgi:hypothetical protein